MVLEYNFRPLKEILSKIRKILLILKNNTNRLNLQRAFDWFKKYHIWMKKSLCQF
jgi:hypothetical protein